MYPGLYCAFVPLLIVVEPIAVTSAVHERLSSQVVERAEHYSIAVYCAHHHHHAMLKIGANVWQNAIALLCFNLTLHGNMNIAQCPQIEYYQKALHALNQNCTSALD